MRIIGITGGVGSGKTVVMNYLKEHYSCYILLADEVAHLVKKKGTACYEELIGLMGREIVGSDGEIDKKKMADILFTKEGMLEAVNAIIHPAVKQYVLAKIEEEQKAGRVDFFFLEAALLIEEKYDEIVDELWYIYADEGVRRMRLKNSRHYTDEKITSIMECQLSEEEFRKHCDVTIVNNGDLSETYHQIDCKLEEYL